MTAPNTEPDQSGDLISANERLMRSLIELRARDIGSAADSSDAYDGLHEAGALRQQDSFYLWLLSLLGPRRGESLLDVSCGQGSLVRFARQAGLVAAGTDLSRRAVTTTRRRSPSVGVSVSDAERLPYASESFAYVTNVGSLEHYFSPPRAVREMARVLQPDGLALVLLPNTFGLLGNVLHVWRTGDVFDDGQPLQRYGTNAQWRQLLELNGLQVRRTFRYERTWPRTWRDLAWYIGRPHRIVRPLLSSLLPANLSSFLVYLCSKGS